MQFFASPAEGAGSQKKLWQKDEEVTYTEVIQDFTFYLPYSLHAWYLI